MALTCKNASWIYCPGTREATADFATKLEAYVGGPPEQMRPSDQADVPAQQPAAQAQARLSRAHEDASRPGHPQSSPGQGPGAPVRVGGRHFSLSSLESLTSSRDFRRVYRTGRRARSDGITVWATYSNEPTTARVGMSIRARAGTAVVRNRFRRRAKAILRDVLPSGAEVVLHADATATGKNFQNLELCLRDALERAGVEYR